MSTVRANTTTPADSHQVAAELHAAVGLHLPTDLSDSAALAVASLWEHTGAPFAALASTGTADADALLSAISDARRIAARDTFPGQSLAELNALEAWVMANADPDDV
jgi:hypothetical protein